MVARSRSVIDTSACRTRSCRSAARVAIDAMASRLSGARTPFVETSTSRLIADANSDVTPPAAAG